MENKFTKKRILSFITAFVMMISVLANNYVFADSGSNFSTTTTNYGIVKVVKVDGKNIQINTPADAEKYKKEFDKKIEELKKQGYTIINSNFVVTKPEIIYSNTTTDGKYMLNGEEWKLEDSYGDGVVFKLVGTGTSNRGQVKYAYCIDILTTTKTNALYQNEEMEKLVHGNFAANADKIRNLINATTDSNGRAIVTNEIKAYVESKLKEDPYVKAFPNFWQRFINYNKIDQELKFATQLLIWEYVHGKPEHVSGVIRRPYTYIESYKYKVNNTTNASQYLGRMGDGYFSAMRVHNMVEYLRATVGGGSSELIQDATIDIRKMEIQESDVSDKLKVVYEYKTQGTTFDYTTRDGKVVLTNQVKDINTKNGDGSYKFITKNLYVGNNKLASNQMTDFKTQELSDGYIREEFLIDKTSTMSIGSVKLEILAEQARNQINALLAKAGIKHSQTLVTTSAIPSMSSVKKSATATVKRTDAKSYSVQLMKVDASKLESGNVSSGISGARFSLIDANGVVQNQASTDVNGKITFSNLKVGAYTIREDESPRGYQSLTEPVKLTVDQDGTVRALVDGKLYSSDQLIIPIVNTKKEIEKIELLARKQWIGVSSEEASRKTVTIQLYKDNVLVKDQTKTITGNSEVRFTGLDKVDENGREIVYDLREVAVDGFTTRKLQDPTNKYVYTFQNTNNYGEISFNKTEVSTSKAVKGATISFYRSGQSVPFLTGITDENGRISRVGATGDVGKIQDNGNIKLEVGRYYLKETNAPKGYTLNPNPQYFDITSGGVVKSTLKDELINKVSIRATKKWAYTDPKKVSNMTSSFRLYSEVQGQMEVATDQIKTLRGEGEVVFDNLDEKTQDGKYIYYTIKEELSNDYEAISSRIGTDGSSFVNAPKNREYTEIEVEKIWKNVSREKLNNNEYRATFELYRDNNEFVNRLTITGEGTGTFTKLPKYNKDNQPYKYEVREVGGNFISERNDVSAQKVVFTNKPADTEKVTLTAVKKWLGVDNVNGYKATIQLFRDNRLVAGQDQVITGDGVAVFANLEKYDENNRAYNYELREVNVEGFTSSRTVNGTTYNFVNTRNAGKLDFTKVELSTQKPVKGATIEFYKENATRPFLTGITDERGKIVSGTATGETHRISADGRITHEIGKYFFKETNEPKCYILIKYPHNFEIKKDGVVVDTLTNELIGKTSVSAKKNWGYVDPSKLNSYTATFELVKNGQTTGITKVLSGNGTVVFDNLDTKDQDGNNITYDVVEVNSPEYKQYKETSIIDAIRNFFNKPTNTDKVSVKVSKTWKQVDKSKLTNGQYKATFDLYQNGQSILSKEVVGNNTITFENLDKFDENNKPYIYTVREREVAGFVSERRDVKENEVSFTNRPSNPETVTLTAEKQWKGVKDADNYTAKIQLYRDGQKVEGSFKTVQGNNTVTFENLPKYSEDNVEYRYELKEERVNGFLEPVVTKNNNAYKFVNEKIYENPILGH